MPASEDCRGTGCINGYKNLAGCSAFQGRWYLLALPLPKLTQQENLEVKTSASGFKADRWVILLTEAADQSGVTGLQGKGKPTASPSEATCTLDLHASLTKAERHHTVPKNDLNKQDGLQKDELLNLSFSSPP